MAVRIDIPGIGTVNAENAATESTLQELTRVLGRSTNQQVRFNQDVQNSFTRIGDYANRSASQIAGVGVAAGSAFRAIQGRTEELADVQLTAFERLRHTSRLYNLVTTNLGNLADTVTEATVAYARNYKQIADNPIEANSKILNKAIGFTTTVAVSVGSSIEAFGKGIPILGTFTKILGNAIAGIAQIVGAGLQGLNEVFSEEAQDLLKSFQTLNKSGGSFSQGMITVSKHAGEAGVLFDQFAIGAARASDQMRRMGLGFEGAIGMVSRTMSKFNDNFGGAMTPVRQQMLAMGYGFEEQVEITAEYLAMLRSTMSAENFRKIQSHQLAVGTANYARNLKILSDITGENAQAAMAEARSRAMEADIMSKLDPEQAERFRNAMVLLPDAAKKGILESISSGGIITDQATNIARANSETFRTFQDGMIDIIMNSKLTGQAAIREMGVLGSQTSVDMQDQLRSGRGGMMDMFGTIGRLTGDATAQGVIAIFNDLVARNWTPEGVQTAIDAANKQGENIQGLNEDFIKLQTSAQEYAQQMQKLVVDHMPEYLRLIGKTNEIMNSTVRGMIDVGSVLSTLDLSDGTVDVNGKRVPVTEFIKDFLGLTGTSPSDEEKANRQNAINAELGSSELVGIVTKNTTIKADTVTLDVDPGALINQGGNQGGNNGEEYPINFEEVFREEFITPLIAKIEELRQQNENNHKETTAQSQETNNKLTTLAFADSEIAKWARLGSLSKLG